MTLGLLVRIESRLMTSPTNPRQPRRMVTRWRSLVTRQCQRIVKFQPMQVVTVIMLHALNVAHGIATANAMATT